MPPVETDDFDSFFDELSRLKPDETPPANFGEAQAVTPPVVPAEETPVVADTPVEPSVGDQATGDGGEPAVVATEETQVEPAAAAPAAQKLGC